MTLASLTFKLTFDAPVYKLQSKVFANESLVSLENESLLSKEEQVFYIFNRNVQVLLTSYSV